VFGGVFFFVVFFLTEPPSLSESQGNTVNTPVNFEIIQKFKTLNYIIPVGYPLQVQVIHHQKDRALRRQLMKNGEKTSVIC